MWSYQLLVVMTISVWTMSLPTAGLSQDNAGVAARENSANEYSTIASKAIGYLETSQEDSGAWSSHAGPAVTALVATSLLRHGRTPNDPLVSRALEYLQGFVQVDGGIYQPGSNHRNYETCLAIVCFDEANRSGRYDELLKKSEAYLGKLQWDEGEGHDVSSANYGGFGYGNHKRPDLSNTQFSLDALYALGSGADDPRVQRALVFVSRCQNLESEHNVTPFAALVGDGGFYYTPAAGGTSQAGETPGGGLRSYGSMTYAGLKSMIYAGVTPDDPRVVAALEWIRRHYTLQENPGMGGAGLYYYYHTFAKALDAIGEDRIKDAAGESHDWRKELIDSLASMQQEDGSWVNPTTRWLEGDPNLVSGYALLALRFCGPR